MLAIDIKKRRGQFQLSAAFEVPTPGVVALFGRSGCGKSTVINIVAGLLSPDEGRIELNGELLVDTHVGYDIAAERRGIGYVFQDAKLFPHMNVKSNLLYGAKRAKKPEGLKSFDPIVQLLGLETLLTQRPHQLSGGERQRVALGRALLTQPRLLLLDEPLASLDRARREEVLPYLESLRDHFAVPMIYVSHQFDEVLRLATHVVILDNGTVVDSGTPAQISLHPTLAAQVGEEAVGAVLDGVVISLDEVSGLAEISIGNGVLRVRAGRVSTGTPVRVQLLARDIILATTAPQGLSVRNMLRGTISKIAVDRYDADESDLVHVDIGGAIVLSRITRAATQALQLTIGMDIWVLVKAMSTRGHTFVRHPGIL